VVHLALHFYDMHKNTWLRHGLFGEQLMYKDENMIASQQPAASSQQPAASSQQPADQ
jgi:hypothetical protein